MKGKPKIITNTALGTPWGPLRLPDSTDSTLGTEVGEWQQFSVLRAADSWPSTLTWLGKKEERTFLLKELKRGLSYCVCLGL